MLRDKFNKSLRFRFLSIIFGILIVGTLVTSLAIAINEGITLRNSLKSEGRRLASYIALLSQEPLIMKDAIHLDAIVNEANTDEDVDYVFIYDAQGKPLTSPYASINFRLPEINAVLLQSSGNQKSQDIIKRIKATEPIVEVSAPITMGPNMIESKQIGTVIMGLNEHRMRREISKILLYVIIFNLGGAIVLGLVLFIASTNIVFDPITELAQASSRLAKGDLSTKVDISTMGEVKTLVNSFNEMVDNLEKVTVSRDYVDNILKSMINTLIVVSADNKIMSTNAATCKLLGYKEEELLGQPIGMITDSKDSNREIWMTDLLANDNVGNIEEFYRTKDGREVAVLLSASVMRDENQLLRGIIYVAQDITKRKQAENSLKESEERLHYLASQLMDAQERERKRIAQELHDDLGQSLLSLKLHLDRIARTLPPDLEKSREDCLHCLDYLIEIIENVRCLSYNLTPAVLDIGLKAAVVDLLDEFSEQRGIECTVDFDEIEGLLSSDQKINLYRIIQESLTNISKYSRAARVIVSLKNTGHQVDLAVEDNGEGFEVPEILARRGREKGLGLSSMAERSRIMGGTFNISSRPQSGTKIQVTVPLPGNRASAMIA